MKYFNLQKIYHAFFATSIMAFTIGCGESVRYKYLDEVKVVDEVEKQTEGTYRVSLIPTNPGIAPNVTAEATVSVEGGSFFVSLTATGTSPQMPHPQHIHLGTACPTQDDDSNNDGIIDVEEAETVVGQALVPLDNTIDANDSNDYPSAAQDGSYSYQQSTNFDELIQDLGQQSEDLALEGRVVEIHGVSADTNLPETVKGGNEELPIACGVLERDDTGETTTGGETTGTTTGGETSGTSTGGKG